MTNLIEVFLDNKTKILLEVFDKDNSEDDLLDTASVKKNTKSKDFLLNAFEQIKLFSNGIASSVKSIDVQPDEFEVAFSVKFSAGAGIIISSVNSEANIIVKMKWDKSKGN